MKLAVRDTIAQFDKAWNDHDRKALAELCAEISYCKQARSLLSTRRRAEQEQQYTKHHGATGPYEDSRSAPPKNIRASVHKTGSRARSNDADDLGNARDATRRHDG